jgi:hypothetical protein
MKCDSNNLISKCGESGQLIIPDDTPPGNTFIATTITIDTTKIRNPCIKLEFSSNVITIVFIGTINFQIYRSCNNQQPIPIGSPFIYSQSVALPTAATTFSFFICDCDECINQCCVYTVVATPVGALTAGSFGAFSARLMAHIAENPELC